MGVGPIWARWCGPGPSQEPAAGRMESARQLLGLRVSQWYRFLALLARLATRSGRLKDFINEYRRAA